MGAYEAGASARAAGHPITANPHPDAIGTAYRHREWHRGWSEWRA